MLWKLLQISSTALGLTIPGALPSWLIALVAILGPLLGYFGARSTAIAPLQVAMNDAFRSVMEELQEDRARCIARISVLESEIRRQRGEINQHLAKEAAFLRLLESHNVPLPTGRKTDDERDTDVEVSN